MLCVGRDPRTGGALLSNALASALSSSRIFVHDAGVVPTPAVAQGVLELSADMGVMITASHNPAHDNGFKFFNAQGLKLSVAEESTLEQLIEAQPNPSEIAYQSLNVTHVMHWRTILMLDVH